MKPGTRAALGRLEYDLWTGAFIAVLMVGIVLFSTVGVR
jgi:hypothetical protein